MQNECSAGIAVNANADKDDRRSTADKISRAHTETAKLESGIVVIKVRCSTSGIAQTSLVYDVTAKRMRTAIDDVERVMACMYRVRNEHCCTRRLGELNESLDVGVIHKSLFPGGFKPGLACSVLITSVIVVLVTCGYSSLPAIGLESLTHLVSSGVYPRSSTDTR